MLDQQKIWQAALGELELMLSKANFTTWFKSTFIIKIDEEKSEVVIGVPNAFTKSWMEQKYNKYVMEALNHVSEKKVNSISYQIESMKKAIAQAAAQGIITPESALPAFMVRDEISTYTLNPRYTFDSFIVGAGNELAHSASLAVSESLGSRYNPLFLYGDVGLGKTHLLQAIGNAIRIKNRLANVLYVSFEKFTNDYVVAVRRGGFDEFRRLYRSAEVLLVDDVQFMIDKEKTQDEFFHTFEVLHQNNRQIVITSDRPPKALVELQDRMISRFEWGMIADIKSPDLETRIAILEKKCRERNFTMSSENILYIAEHVKNSVRELEGALNKIVALYELSRKEPTLHSVKEILAGLMIDPSKRALSPKKIVQKVAEFYELSLEDIMGSCRKKELVLPRQIVMYLMRQELEYSYPAIGSNLGGRDHTTIMYACQKIGELLDEEERLRQDVETIKQRLYT